MALDLADVLSSDPAASAGMLIGTVTVANTDGTVMVAIGGAEVLLHHLRDYTPAVNHNVLILRQGQRLFVIGAFVPAAATTTPDAPAPTPSQPPPTKPKPPTRTKVTKTFTASGTGCFRGGKWRTDTRDQPHQGDWNGAFGRNTGAWFYGSSMATTMRGAKVLSASIYMRRLSGGVFGAVSPTVYTTPHPSKPSGAPTLLGSGVDLHSMAVNTSGWFTFPVSLAQQFSDGTAKGLACWVNADDPYMAFAGLRDSRSTGALRITYEVTT